MPAGGLAESPSLDFAAETYEVVYGLAVGDVGYVLVDDRPGV